jgi:hypothetical protein
MVSTPAQLMVSVTRSRGAWRVVRSGGGGHRRRRWLRGFVAQPRMSRLYNGIPQSSVLRVAQNSLAGLSAKNAACHDLSLLNRTRPTSTSCSSRPHTTRPPPALAAKAGMRGEWTLSIRLPRRDAHAHSVGFGKDDHPV